MVKTIWAFLSERLVAKILAAVFITLTGVATPFLLYQLATTRHDILTIHQDSWELFRESVHRSLVYAMLEGRSDLAVTLLAEYAETPDITAVEVVRLDGTRAFGIPDRVVEPEELQRLAGRERASMTGTFQGIPVYTSMAVLRNEQRCMECHARDPAILGAVVIRASTARTAEEAYGILFRTVMLAALAALVLLFTIPLVVRRWIVLPIRNVVVATEDIARGELSHPMTTARHDEVGRLVRAVEATRSGLSGLLAKVHDALEGVRTSLARFAGVSARVTGGAEQQAADSLGISDSVQQIRAGTKAATGAVERLHGTVGQSHHALVGMQGGIRAVAESSNSFGAFIADTSAAITQAVKSIEEITENIEQSHRTMDSTHASAAAMLTSLGEVRDSTRDSARLADQVTTAIRDNGMTAIDEARRKMAEVREMSVATSRAVADMGRASERIDAIIHVINDVASATKLLALNAAILSSQAGESGRGFAVVAEKMRSLAGRTAENTQEIGAIVHDVKQRVAVIVASQPRTAVLVEDGTRLIDEAGNVFTGILDTSKAAASQAGLIERAAEQQRQMLEGFNTALASLAGRLETIANATHGLRSRNEPIVAGVKHLGVIAQDLGEAADRQSRGVDLLTQGGEVVLQEVASIRRSMVEMHRTAESIARRVETISTVATGNLSSVRELQLEATALNQAYRTLEAELTRFTV